MLTDYKFWYIKRDDSGVITECAVRYYEGDVTSTGERMRDGGSVLVARYRRTRRLSASELGHLGGRAGKEASGADVRIFTVADFGAIKTDGELQTFLNAEMNKDLSREPIPQQI